MLLNNADGEDASPEADDILLNCRTSRVCLWDNVHTWECIKRQKGDGSRCLTVERDDGLVRMVLQRDSVAPFRNVQSHRAARGRSAISAQEQNVLQRRAASCNGVRKRLDAPEIRIATNGVDHARNKTQDTYNLFLLFDLQKLGRLRDC